MIRTKPTVLAAVMLAFFALTAAAGDARADRKQTDRREANSSQRDGGRVYDNRYNHNRYYPARGQIVASVPRAARSVRYRGVPYYYNGGSWYRPSGPRFTIVAPPFGLIVPYLPSFYTTIWVGGMPYYYADNVYYRWLPQQRGYEVSEPPDDSTVSTSLPSGDDQLFVYPKNGQSAEQQATDRYECHTWAADQTRYDPSQPDGGVSPQQANDQRAAYFRAMTACLEGRGYSVR